MTDLSKTQTSGEDIRQLARAFVEQEFKVISDPLFGFKIFKLSNNEHVLVSAFDHLISDGTSTEIISREIWTLYNQAVHGIPFELSRLSIQLSDYYVWLRQIHNESREVREDYWRRYLTGASATQIPMHDDLTDAVPSASKVAHISFGEELSTGLAEVARGERTFLSLVVFTVHIIVMAHWCSQRDVLACFVCNGRFLPELKNVTGCIVDWLHIRAHIAHRATFRDLLRQVMDEMDSAMKHRDPNRYSSIPGCERETELKFNWIPTNFGRLRNAAQVHSIIGHRDISRTSIVVPECDTHLVFNSPAIDFEQPLQKQSPYMSGHIQLQPFHFTRRLTPHPKFYALFYETPVGINVTVFYRSDCVAPNAIARFGRNLRAIAGKFAENPRAAIESISLETE